VTALSSIDALANYFKHRDEWPNEWNQLKDSQRNTASILRDLGLLKDERGTIVRCGDFRDGFKLLVSHDRYDRLHDLGKILNG
jgi:hypothetical protein